LDYLVYLLVFSKNKTKSAVKVCPKLSGETALIIAEETWEQQGDIFLALFKSDSEDQPETSES
jgi:hypothetical protein